MCAPLRLRSVLTFPLLSSRFDRTWAAWFSTFLFFGSSQKNTTCSAVPFSLPSSILYRYGIPMGPRMKQITSLWNSRVGCLAFCLCFKCWLGRDVRTITDGGPDFHCRRLLIWTNALQPCWALLWFSGFAEDFYFSTIHFTLSCCECMNTHADRGLLLMGVFENCHRASPFSSTWDPARCLFHSLFFFPSPPLLLHASGAVSVSLRPLRTWVTLTFKPSRGCSSWITWAWFNWELHLSNTWLI